MFPKIVKFEHLKSMCKYIILTFSLFISLGNSLNGQPADKKGITLGLMPFKKPENQLPGMNDYFETKILELAKSQPRFSIIDNTNSRFNSLNMGTSGLVDSAKLAGVTHLVQFTVHTMTFKDSPNPIPHRFDTMEFRLRMEADVDFEMEVFDVATGEIVASEKLNGHNSKDDKIGRIPLTVAAWSKEKGVHNSQRSPKDIENDKKKFLKDVEVWKREVQKKAADQALANLDRKLRRLFLPEVNIIEIIEESKGKATRVAISEADELAFARREGIEVVVKSSIEFNGEIIEREKQIGKLKFLEVSGGKTICKVTDGKEDILQAFKKGDKLICKIE